MLVKGTIFQFGGQEVCVRDTGLTVDLALPETTTVVIAANKDDAGTTEWEKLTRDPEAYVMRQVPILQKAGIKRGSWAKNFFLDRQQVEAAKATNFHGYWFIHNDGLDEALSFSGHAALTLTPKGQDRATKHDPRYRILELRGATLKEARATAQKTLQTCGIVTPRNGYALRVRKHSYNAVKKNIFSDADTSDNDLAEPAHKFTLMNVPEHGPSNRMLSKQLGGRHGPLSKLAVHSGWSDPIHRHLLPML